MNEIICIKAKITGKVQGVFFRKSTQEEANKRNITGWVTNQKDGSVELIACGSSSNIALLIEWIEGGGPSSAEIASFEWNETSPETHESFKVR